MTQRIDRLKELFSGAAELSHPEERRAYLDRACGPDVDLRRRLEELLRAHDKPATVVDAPLVAPLAEPQPLAPAVERVGHLLAGRYKLLEQLGEGGMGTVWVADQTEPVRRKVAIKLVKAGMDTRAVLSRFDAERQALALMDHPNIARVFDGGMTEAGRPYFVMEFVKGVPILDYCDAHRLNIIDRLKLFVPVCHAVQHAHQKGIIHRDLKPTNILVCMYDGLPIPKIIDFGLAKAIHQPLTEQTLYTAQGLMMGTPLYMSPEQAEINNLDIDTRADIYSLGVVLYELLTGTTPLERQRFRNAAWQEMLRVIKEEDPPTPSTRLSGSATLPSVAAQRHLEPIQLTRLVKGELDWIVMKCLEKDRARRYESATGLANDIQRYLTDEIVEARPPSPGYRWRKFLRRNRSTVLATVLTIGLLVAGIIGTTTALWESQRQRQATDRARQSESRQRIRAEEAEALARENERSSREAAQAERAARELAQKRLTQVEKANEVLSSIFSDLNPEEAARDGLPLKELLSTRLDDAAQMISGELIGDSLAVARMQQVLGRSFLGLGLPLKAEEQFRQADLVLVELLGRNDPETLRCRGDLATSLRLMGKVDLALPLHRETLDTWREIHGSSHPEVAAAMDNLASTLMDLGDLEQALPLFEDAWEQRRQQLGADHSDTLASINNLAAATLAARRSDRAIELFQENLRLVSSKHGPQHPHTLASLNNLGTAYLQTNRLDLALPTLSEAVKLRQTTLGKNHPSTIHSMLNLAECFRRSGKLDEALELNRQQLKLAQAQFGESHAATLASMNNLAATLLELGELESALALHRDSLQLRRSSLGNDHPATILSLNNLASTYRELGQLQSALPLFEEAAQGVEKLRFEHPYAPNILKNTWTTCEAEGHWKTAEQWRRKWLVVIAQQSGANSTVYEAQLAELAWNLIQQQDWSAAEQTLRQCQSIQQLLPPDRARFADTKLMLGLVMLQLDRQADADQIMSELIQSWNEIDAAVSPTVKQRLYHTGLLIAAWYADADMTADAEAWQQRLVPWQKDQ